MIYSKAKDTHLVPDWDIVEYAVRRNFGGLHDVDFDPVQIFREHLDAPPQHDMVGIILLADTGRTRLLNDGVGVSI